MTAREAVREHGRVAAGERVLVVGATGGVGHFALQIAVADGAEVDAVCSAKNAELARELGATRVIDYRNEDIADAVDSYDVVIDTAGALPLSAARRMLRAAGRWVAVSAGNAGDWLGPLPRMLAMNLRNIGQNTKFITFLDTPSAHSLEQLNELVARGELRPVVQQTYDLSEVSRALADQQAGGSRGKRVIVVRSTS
jgi:NADPH:quinone reductase-like Zn-dependent oxidoreductase